MKLNFKNSILLSALFLSGCTMAVHDPAKFEQQATHKEKIYNVPMQRMYTCVIKDILIAPPAGTWHGDNQAYYGLPGIYRFDFKKIGPSKTSVRYSNVGTYWIKFGEQLFALADMCAEANHG